MNQLMEIRVPSRTAPRGGWVRPLAEDDVPRIAELHQKLLSSGGRRPRHEIESRLLEIFCRHPWRDNRLPSLVYEDTDGKVIGCLGVMPRPMWMEGRPITAAVTHTFMVDQERRSTLAAMHLLKTFFSGPQDLSVAEGNSLSRKLWEGLGGVTSMLYSLRWTHPLRPARYSLSLLEKRGLSGWLVALARPVSRVLDFAATRVPESPLRPVPPVLVADQLDSATLLECVAQFSRRCSLRPRYDRRSLDWLIQFLAGGTERGILRNVLLRKQNRIAGWYMYYANPDGISEVVQLGATEETAADVLEHLFWDAGREGATAVSGQVDPSLMSAFSEKFCLFHRGRGGSWILVHSRNQHILRAMQLGEAYFTRLDGEWSIAG